MNFRIPHSPFRLFLSCLFVFFVAILPAHAQIPTATAGQMNTVLVGGAALLSLVALWKSVFPTRRPPIEAEFATKEELLQLRSEINDRLTGVSAKIDRMRLEMRDEQKEIQLAAHERVAGLHRRLDEMRDALVGDVKAILEKIGELRAGKEDKV